MSALGEVTNPGLQTSPSDVYSPEFAGMAVERRFSGPPTSLGDVLNPGFETPAQVSSLRTSPTR
ncbi:MAG: hypothetical protein ACLFVZ_07130 [Actinomycetota bacterium]